MIKEVVLTDLDEFVALAKEQTWLETDIEEAKKFGSKNIPKCFEKAQRNFLHLSVIYNDDKVISMIALEFDNALTYFNTVHVKECLGSYLKFLKKLIRKYTLERSYLITKTLNSYTTANKKNKLLGFKRVAIRDNYTIWVVKNGNN